MRIASAMTELIGSTPLLRLSRIMEKYELKAEICAKLESANPGGSAKDRIALNMIEAAEREGRLSPGGAVIEPTSGNTGIGIAAICASRGYRAIIVMPDSMSAERRRLIAGFGAKLVLTPGSEGMSGAVKEAERIRRDTPGSIIAGQFANPANPEAHYAHTGPELWRDTQGEISALVAGIGSGGTLSGAGRYLKEQNSDILLVGVEPFESPLLTRGFAAPHGIQGIGANFVPEVLDVSLIDRITAVKTSDAIATARELMRSEGILCGISGGAALFAAIELARQEQFAGKRIAFILPDTGERYLSSTLFDEEESR